MINGLSLFVCLLMLLRCVPSAALTSLDVSDKRSFPVCLLMLLRCVPSAALTSLDVSDKRSFPVC